MLWICSLQSIPSNGMAVSVLSWSSQLWDAWPSQEKVLKCIAVKLLQLRQCNLKGFVEFPLTQHWWNGWQIKPWNRKQIHDSRPGSLVFPEYSKLEAYVLVQQVLKTEGNCQGRMILHVEKVEIISIKMQKIFAVRIYQTSIFNCMNHFPWLTQANCLYINITKSSISTYFMSLDICFLIKDITIL